MHIPHKAWRDPAHTARHEAGHAVASVLAAQEIFGNPCGFESIEIRSDGTGEVTNICTGPWVWRPTMDVEEPPWLRSRPYFDEVVLAMKWHVSIRYAAFYAEVKAIRGFKTRRGLVKGVASSTWSPFWRLMFRDNSSGWGQDISEIMAYCRRLEVETDEPVDSLPLCNRAADLVLDYWSAIDALGAALVESGRMDFEEAYAVIAPHMETIG